MKTVIAILLATILIGCSSHTTDEVYVITHKLIVNGQNYLYSGSRRWRATEDAFKKAQPNIGYVLTISGGGGLIEDVSEYNPR